MKRLVYSFFYGDGKSEMLKREYIELDKDKGGLGLYDLDTFCKAIFVSENVCIPSHKDFDHQRKDLFQYLFSFWLRNFYPNLTRGSHIVFHSWILIGRLKTFYSGLKRTKTY